jgi:hypothetical protein
VSCGYTWTDEQWYYYRNGRLAAELLRPGTLNGTMIDIAVDSNAKGFLFSAISSNRLDMFRSTPYVFLSFALSVGGATITGKVVNDRGTGVSHALVNVADPTSSNVGLRRYVQIDENGKFVVGSVPAGTYNVYARVLSDGYGDPEFAVFAVDLPPSPKVYVGQTR